MNDQNRVTVEVSNLGHVRIVMRKTNRWNRGSPLFFETNPYPKAICMRKHHKCADKRCSSSKCPAQKTKSNPTKEWKHNLITVSSAFQHLCRRTLITSHLTLIFSALKLGNIRQPVPPPLEDEVPGLRTARTFVETAQLGLAKLLAKDGPEESWLP